MALLAACWPGAHTVQIPQAIEHIAAGDRLTAKDFILVDVPAHLAASYVHGLELPEGTYAGRPLSPGELLSTSTLSTQHQGSTLVLPLTVPVSADIKPGQDVTIWRVPRTHDGQASIVAQHAIFVVTRETRSMSDGKQKVEVRLNEASVAHVMTALGQGDEFVVIAEGKYP